MVKDLRRFMNPEKRVILYDGDITQYKVNEKTEYESVYTEDEIKTLVISSGKKKLFNGECVRLDSVDNGVCQLSKVGFFDFLSSNLTYLPANKNLMSTLDFVRCYIADPDFRRIKALEARIRTRVLGYGKLRTVKDVLGVKELANIVTVSILLEDVHGRLLLVKRGNKVAISSGAFAVSAAGSVSVEDLEADDPFLNCAKRELREELNLDVDLQFTALVISKQKLQPAALYYGKLTRSFDELVETMQSAPDFKEENETLFAVPKGVALSAIRRFQFTDVAAYQIFYTAGKKSSNSFSRNTLSEYAL